MVWGLDIGDVIDYGLESIFLNRLSKVGKILLFNLKQRGGGVVVVVV